MTAEERIIIEQRVKGAFSDELFVRDLFALDEPEQVQIKLKEKGIVLTLDEVRMIPRALRKAQQSGDELFESDLEDVAAGVIAPVAVALIVDCVTSYSAFVQNRNW